MDSSTDDLPPPYFPPAQAGPSSLNSQASAVPRWIIVYAMVGKPLLWALHRVANGFELYSARGTDGFYVLLGMFVLWSLGSLVVIAIVYAGGVHAWAKSTQRPRLLRFGLGCSIAWSVLLVAVVIFLVGVSLSAQQAEQSQNGGADDVTVALGALIWTAGLVAEWLAWRRLGRADLIVRK